MSNYTITMMYVPFLLICGYVFISELIRFIRHRGSLMLALMAISIVGWAVFMLAVVFIEDNVSGITFLWNIALTFISLTITSQFFVIHGVFFPEHKLPKWVMVSFFVMPLLNAFIALSPFAYLIREVELISVYPQLELNNVRGPWFWVHTVHAYILALITIATLIRGHLRKPKFYRLSSYLIVVGITITLLSNLVTLANLMPFGVDASALAASLAVMLYYLATSNRDQNLYARQARGRVFDYMDDFVLVLGKDGHVTDFNSSASRWFSSIGIELRATTLDGLLDALKEKGAEISQSPTSSESKDITYNDGGFTVVLSLEVREMVDDKRYKYGSIAFFFNVTQNRALLNRLEKEAGMDSLTGLANRVAYVGAKKRLDNPEYLPLSVVVCDANNLKVVNDTLGHNYGDMLLQTTAKALVKVCKKEHFLARVGGDEFILLLPNTDAKSASNSVDKIKQSVADYTCLPFELNLAVGAATKSAANEILEDVITTADTLMYEDKKRMKQKTRN
ncbi:MAG: diguanylate cyclase [Defluviitaleaceae bacterium]|nr:diguanylate cyclase [Defluviitaleaceae bacterium]